MPKAKVQVDLETKEQTHLYVATIRNNTTGNNWEIRYRTTSWVDMLDHVEEYINDMFEELIRIEKDYI